MKTILLVLFLFVTTANAETYNVTEISTIDSSVTISEYEFNEENVFIINNIEGEYLNGIAYVMHELGGTVVYFIRSGVNILGFKMSVDNKTEYNFYIIFGVSNG